MRTAIIRAASTADYPARAYVSSVGHDGSFAITSRKEKAWFEMPHPCPIAVHVIETTAPVATWRDDALWLRWWFAAYIQWRSDFLDWLWGK